MKIIVAFLLSGVGLSLLAFFVAALSEFFLSCRNKKELKQAAPSLTRSL